MSKLQKNPVSCFFNEKDNESSIFKQIIDNKLTLGLQELPKNTIRAFRDLNKMLEIAAFKIKISEHYEKIFTPCTRRK